MNQKAVIQTFSMWNDRESKADNEARLEVMERNLHHRVLSLY